MSIRRPDTTLDVADSRLMVEFNDPAGFLIAVNPIYVVGIQELNNGVAIRTQRGAAPDQFLVRGPVRDVIDRLRRAWDVAQDSFLAHFMAADLGALQDRLMSRLTDCMNQELRTTAKAIHESIPGAVRQEVARLAEADKTTEAAKATPRPVVRKPSP